MRGAAVRHCHLFADANMAGRDEVQAVSFGTLFKNDGFRLMAFRAKAIRQKAEFVRRDMLPNGQRRKMREFLLEIHKLAHESRLAVRGDSQKCPEGFGVVGAAQRFFDSDKTLANE